LKLNLKSLRKKYEDAKRENDELDRVLKNAVESAASEIGVQAETIQQLKSKLDTAVKKGELSESQLQMAIRTIQGLEEQVTALQNNVDENVAYLYGEMYVMHEILKKIMNNPRLKVDDNEEKKMSDMYESLISRLDLEGSAEYSKFLENGASIAQLNSIFAKIDEEPTDFLEDVMDLTSYLNELHAKYMAAKSSGKKYSGAAADLAKLYYALSGKSTSIC
jgi:small-conductance mechanosensitive channel